MKHKLLFYISLFLAITCFGKKIYTMASSDFTNQFNKTKFLQRVYCTNEKKEKVWLYCNDNTNLTITLSNKKQEKLAQRGWTVRLIFEQSLRSFLGRESAESPAAPFRLQHTVVKGKGLVNPGLSFASMLEQSGVNRQPSVKRKK